MIRVLKVLTLILYFMCFLFFRVYLVGFMMDGKFVLLLLTLICGLIIALTVYFTAIFMERLKRTENRVKSITKRKNL